MSLPKRYQTEGARSAGSGLRRDRPADRGLAYLRPGGINELLAWAKERWVRPWIYPHFLLRRQGPADLDLASGLVAW
jgi:hypothetical protein